ncbi:MAG: nitrate- and nitrite sensing domain-containing protein [Proteobacteria bacterium]|nr:nitrate- and nitrite sensing domain-containing protein [Pseudomonadota bacterium]
MASKGPRIKLNIRSKLLLLLMLPLAGLLFFSANSALDRSFISEEMSDLDALAGLSTKLGALSHELQKERGMTAGFLGSKGVLFANELPLQRKDTDQKQKEFVEALSGFNRGAYDAVIGEMLDESGNNLKDLASKRSSVTAQKIRSTDAIGYYSRTINSLLNVPHRATTMSDDAAVAQRALSYSNLLQSKERAGRDRAILSNAFAADSFSSSLAKTYLANDAQEQTYLDEFLFTATPEQKSFYKSKHTGQAVNEVKRLKRLANRNTDGGKLGVDAGHWFSVATSRIDILKTVEDKLASDLHTATAELHDTAQTNFYLFIGLALGGVLVALVLAFLTVRNITRSTGRLSSAVAKVAEGDFEARSEVTSGDELGDLSKAFDTMLDERVGGLVKAEKESEMLNTSIIAILRSVAKLGKGDLTIKAPVNEDITGALADSINQMSEGINDTLAHVNQASNQVRQTSTKARDITGQGKETVMNTAKGMNEIRGTIQETAKRIKRLGERSQDIGVIVKLIDDISERTNVLALNANMQAAQAGEAGRGFMVVADEVQRLAESSKEATDQISKLVNSIQVETGDTIATMDKTIEEVVQGGELAEQAASQMELVEQTVAQLDALGIDLAQAVGAFTLTESAEQVQAAPLKQAV